MTKQPVTTLVYSHAHKDHIGGSAAFADIEGLEIVALTGVAEFLAGKNDPNRLKPTRIFDDQLVLNPGGRESSFGPRTTTRTRATSLFICRRRAF